MFTETVKLFVKCEKKDRYLPIEKISVFPKIMKAIQTSSYGWLYLVFLRSNYIKKKSTNVSHCILNLS